MRLTPTEVEAGCYGLAGYVRHMTTCVGRPVHHEVTRLLRRLELERSVGGTENDFTAAELVAEELIGTAAAATILGCSTRRVRVLAKDLDGQRCGREWIFRRSTVQEYQEARHDGRRSSSGGVPRLAG